MIYRLSLVLSITILFGLVAFLYFKFDPVQFGVFFPQCILNKNTGLLCPGCGTQRALHSLLNGDILNALKLNMFFVVIFPYLVFYFAEQAYYWIKKERKVSIIDSKISGEWIFVFVSLFTIGRNVPVFYQIFLSQVS